MQFHQSVFIQLETLVGIRPKCLIILQKHYFLFGNMYVLLSSQRFVALMGETGKNIVLFQKSREIPPKLQIFEFSEL